MAPGDGAAHADRAHMPSLAQAAPWEAHVGMGDDLIVDTARRILSDHCDPGAVNRAQDEAWKAPAWRALQDAGLTLAWVDEALGGAGGGLGDGFAVVRQVGR